MRSALKGVRVVDFTESIAGPFATLLLAWCGAEVIRVESRYRLGFRRVGPWGPKGNKGIPLGPEKTLDFSKVDLNLLVSPLFAQLNAYKHSITLNVSTPQGADLIKRLIAMSDVVVDNLRFGIMEKWGLDYVSLAAIKRDIIVANLRSMGKGPRENWNTWAMNLMSFTGFSHGWGLPDTPMTNRVAGRYYGDYISAAKAAAAIMGALFYRAMTGHGQHLELAQVEATASVLGPVYLDYFANHRIMPPRGNRNSQFAPHNCYKCRGEDNWCVIAVSSEKEWNQFCQALNNPAWMKAPKFKDMKSRLNHVDELDALIQEWTVKHTPHQVMGLLQSFGVAAGAVQNSEALFHDIQLRTAHFLKEQDLPRLGTVLFTDVPLQVSEEESPVRPHAPMMGEYNDHVFKNLLGLSPQEVKNLEEAKVIF